MISLIKSVFHGQSTDSVKFPDMDSYLKTLKKADLSRQNDDLVSYDMFSADDPDKAIVDKKLNGEVPFSSSRENKAFGTFIGTAVGNALGVFTEGFKLDYDRKEVKDFEYKHSSIMKRSGPGHYTAGTSLALCLADSLLYKNFNYDGKDIRYRFLLWCYSGYNNGKSIEPNPALKISTGAGRSIFNSISEFIDDPTDKVSSYGKQTNDNGNGTLIRLAPLPIAFIDDMNKCLESAVEQSFTTHNGIEAAECCKLISFVAWHFLSIESVGECKAFLEQLGSSFKTECVPVQCLAQSVQEDPSNLKLYHPAFNLAIEDRNWNWKNPEYKFSPCRSKLETALIGMYCMDATAMALHIIYHADTFQDAVLKAINLGGDSVSLGSIVGMLAGAMFGFDEDIKKLYLEHVSKWDQGKCALRAYKLIKPSEEKFKQATPKPEIVDKENYAKPV